MVLGCAGAVGRHDVELILLLFYHVLLSYLLNLFWAKILRINPTIDAQVDKILTITSLILEERCDVQGIEEDLLILEVIVAGIVLQNLLALVDHIHYPDVDALVMDVVSPEVAILGVLVYGFGIALLGLRFLCTISTTLRIVFNQEGKLLTLINLLILLNVDIGDDFILHFSSEGLNQVHLLVQNL